MTHVAALHRLLRWHCVFYSTAQSHPPSPGIPRPDVQQANVPSSLIRASTITSTVVFLPFLCDEAVVVCWRWVVADLMHKSGRLTAAILRCVQIRQPPPLQEL